MRNFRNAGIFAFSMMLVMILGSALISALLHKTGSDSLLLQYGLFYGLQFLLPILVYFYLTKESPRSVLQTRLPRPYTFVLAILFALLVQPALMLISSFSSTLFHNYVDESMAQYTAQPIWISLLCVAVLPAVFEEMLSRGIFLSGCRELGIYTASLLSGLFFGMLHLNPQQGLYAVVFGAFCAFLAIGAGSIWPAILAHALINGTQLLLAYGLTSADSDVLSDAAQLSAPSAVQLATALLLLAMAIWCLVRVYYVNQRENLLTGKASESGQPLLSFPAALPGLLWICAAGVLFVLISILVR
ncbi:MAG: CPBP family intramembrane metalloprotease [Firmicutes bacterium]|nr:CPBP family intramembrane metalloprotease [Bacillota bacterium]